MFFEAGERSLSYSSNDDLSSLAVDEEGQMARFVAKILRVCSRLVVLTYCIGVGSNSILGGGQT